MIILLIISAILAILAMLAMLLIILLIILVILVGRLAWIKVILLISLDAGQSFVAVLVHVFRACVGSARNHDTQVRLVAGVP